MTSTSHRRCQYRGDGCSGFAHAGHDQCAHCYFQYVKPALQAERDEVKRRKAIKKQRLWPETRAHINAVDLDEPQMLERPAPLETVSRAISGVLVNAEINRAIANGKDPIDYAGKMLTRMAFNDIPLPIVRPTAIQKETEPVPENEETSPTTRPPLSDEAKTEVCDAYAAGMNVNEILRAYEIHTGILYPLLKAAGIPLRSTLQRPPSPPRRMPQMPSITPQASHTPAQNPSVNGTSPGLPMWSVTFTVRRTETLEIAAKSFNDAASAVETEPRLVAEGVEVVSVAKVID